MTDRVITCVYCGHEYPQGTPAAGSGVLTEHIKACRAHPMRKAEADIALLRSALAGLIGSDSEPELRQIEATMRLLPAPEEDKAVSINAIHALLATSGAGHPAIEKIKEAVRRNNQLQGETEMGSTAWHAHETIDDLLFDALAALGD